MPAKHFLVDPKADKQLFKLPRPIKEKIAKRFEVLQQNPLLGEKLGGELNEYRKYRVGDYRIVYRFDAKTSLILVVKIEHRQGVYK